MKYIGVTSFIAQFKDSVNWEAKAKKKAKEKGVPIEQIKDDWEKDRKNGINLHSTIQEELSKLPNTKSYKVEHNDNFYNSLPEKDIKLENNTIYLERPCFSSLYGIIGFPDRIDVKNNTISIEDYKTYKKLYRTSLGIKIGSKVIKEKFYKPIEHLDTCNYIEACLQLSLYMYILWETNRHLKVGKLYITHITLDDEGKEDTRVKEEVPYMREEIRALLNYKKRKNI